jgi:hypothetical protein
VLYEFENPSDPYVFEAANREIAALTVFVIGTAYGATAESGNAADNVPIFIFGGASEWYKETFGREPKEGMNALKREVAESFTSFMFGNIRDWRRYNAALNAIDDPGKRAAFRDEWQDGRSSLNNIGSYAHQLGARLREKSDNNVS